MRNKGANSLVLDSSPDEFFFGLVQDAIRHQQVRVLPETEFYLVKLLKRFIQSENLFVKNSNGELQDQPLSFLFKEALEAPSPTNQKNLFQNVGDISLYKVGFFQESLSRAAIPVDYYIGMGGTAYYNAAERSEEKHYQSLFQELSQKFESCVDILFEVSEKTTITKTEQDLLRLYEMWSRTGSERAARALLRAGIALPTAKEKKESF
jgi:hypothetical protein